VKIRIVGGPGSGKTRLAAQLSAHLGVPHYDLDELLWDNAADGYGTKRDPAERDALLQALLRQDDWIIEGAYYVWCGATFAQADRIILLRVPRRTYRRRIVRRFVRRKLGLERGKRETLRSLQELLRWADKYEQVNLPELRAALAPYADKLEERGAT